MKIIEKCITDASMDALEKALEAYGYTIQRTKHQISATHGGTFCTNGHLSVITVTDDGNIRKCQDIETSMGYCSSPERGLLAKIVKYAETPDSVKTKAKNPTSQKQGALWGVVIAFCVIMLIGTIVLLSSI